MKNAYQSDIERIMLAIRSKCKEILSILIPPTTRVFRQAYLQLVKSFVGKGINKSQGFLHLLVVGGILLAVSPTFAGIGSSASSQTNTDDQNQKTFMNADHKAAYKSLSPKNQAALDSLPIDDQKSVVKTYKKGGDHQQHITTILNQDQQQNAPSDANASNRIKANGSGSSMTSPTIDQKNANSPASQSMRKQQKASSNNGSNIFD